MYPTLKEGTFVFVHPNRKPKAGEIAVLKHPHNYALVVIKRCIHLSENELWIEGDNPAHSTDSRKWGWVPKNSIIGTCTSIL